MYNNNNNSYQRKEIIKITTKKTTTTIIATTPNNLSSNNNNNTTTITARAAQTFTENIFWNFCNNAHTHTYSYMFSNIQINIHIWSKICMWVCVYVCMCICAKTCVNVLKSKANEWQVPSYFCFFLAFLWLPRHVASRHTRTYMYGCVRVHKHAYMLLLVIAVCCFSYSHMLI